ncbi:hypothetical protein Q2K19_22280 [Micromonospora soli]|uniref:hypothetical protein n=1 Tax=Micromonospora sp. NBRC 110009 TaxID=3061627 RepID=UPI002671E029|nr:hypothetical protein [Micromonospora sp. NBRC 110009]WKT96900.1 hypothetical protein Q2K19_22280 [Micromonospora sp. NBRC 110009]
MSRARYGDWGASLDDYEFAKALAAAGVAMAAGEPTLQSFRTRVTADGPAHYPWRSPDPDRIPSAPAWETAWREGTMWPKPVLSVPLDPADPETVWTLETLAVVADVYIPLDTARTAESWRLPIRIGLLDDGPGRALLAGLRQEIGESAWRRELIEPVVIGRERIACDILVLPGPASDTTAAIAKIREIRCGTVVVQRADEPWTRDALAALADRTGAWSIGVGPSRATAETLVELIRELSHNVPFEEAFGGIILAGHDAVGRHSIARRALLTAQLLRDSGPSLASEVNPIALANQFEDVATRGAFESEGGEATELLHLERVAAPLIRAAAGTRALQARIVEADRPEPPLAEWLAGTRHRIDVRIGVDATDWFHARTAFPEDPHATGSRPLVVLLTEPDLLPAPLVADLQLPLIGDSATISFELTTRPDTTAVDARLIVLCGNRLLQTARLPASVGVARPETAPAAKPEITVAPPTAEVAERRSFDATLFVGPGADGNTQMTAVAGPAAATIRFTDNAVNDAMKRIQARLSEVVAGDEQTAGLTAPAAVELLIFLAYRGSLLRMAIERDAAGFTEALHTTEYVQVVSAEADAFLPLELVYDFPQPKESASLCPEAIATLGAEQPGGICPGPHTADVVCPFGFWGLSKVIERQAFRPGARTADGFQLRGCPSRDRNRITLGPIVFATSDRVDGFAAGSVKMLATALGRFSATRRVEIWDDWAKAVKESRPAVLMVLPHTVHSAVYDGYGLEIGADARIWPPQIDRGFLPPDDRPVIVALLGCATACAGEISYEEFPGILRGAGAEVVIATLTEVLGRHAAPVAASLIEELYGACRREPHGLGEVMLQLRRRLLAEGNLTVLALAAFGDADWLISAEA